MRESDICIRFLCVCVFDELDDDKTCRKASAAHMHVLKKLGLPEGTNKMLSVSAFLNNWGVKLERIGLDTAELIIMSHKKITEMNINGRKEERNAKHKGVAVMTTSGKDVSNLIPGMPYDTSLISVEDFKVCTVVPT